jgi:hypothetical protein
MSFSQEDRSRNCINWRSIFIRDNFLVLGYFAWAGFRIAGKGLLMCDVEPPPIGTAFRFYTWNFTTKFVPNLYRSDCLLGLEISSTEIPELIDLIDKFDPQIEIVLLIHASNSIEIFWLKNLEIDPPACYLQVRDRWDEFMSNPLPPDLYVSDKFTDFPN